MINEPAKAKELTSIPKRDKMAVPNNKNPIINAPAVVVATVGFICIPLFFISMIIGRLPNISITENKIVVTDKIAAIFISKCIFVIIYL